MYKQFINEKEELNFFWQGKCWKCRGELKLVSHDEMLCDGYSHSKTAYKCNDCGADYTEYKSEDPNVASYYVEDCTWEDS